jgi:hypothetical protein
MLDAKLQRAALKTATAFDKAGTELAVIVRTTAATNEYGGEAEASEAESTEYPCILQMPSTSQQQQGRFVVGTEYMNARVLMPAMYQGEAVDITPTDRLKILEREGNNPERLYEVRDVQNNFGVYLDIGVVTA